MTLAPGTRLGSFEVVAALGAGGMGEVYRARDIRLGRDVAIKILPDTLAIDPARLARFEREARALAALNHPHIAQIYGVEELRGSSASGATASSSGVALVMELVEGEDLSARLARGALTADAAVAIARQIADALEAAHERGIVHRDLKPANIKVRVDGTVKLLDFGLAKDVPAPPADSDSTVAGPVGATEYGIVVGTPGYMSPEQATGQTVDQRTDIWAFGCLLYEMLSGREPFKGATSLDTLAGVVKSDPDWSAIASAPPALQSLVRACLKKDVRQRVHHIADVRIWLDEPVSLSAAAASRRPSRALVWAFAAVAVLAAAVGAAGMFALSRREVKAAPSVVRFQITPPADQPFSGRPSGTNFAISPDGSTIAYHVLVGDTFQLARRKLDAVEATLIAGTERAQNPTFAPDGSQLAFFSGGAIRTVPIGGGSATTVCEISSTPPPFLAWSDTDDIFISQLIGGLMRVPAKGGTPVLVLAPDAAKGESGFFGVAASPGGRIIITIVPMPGGSARTRTAILLPGATEAKTVLDGIGGAQYAVGHLIYQQGGALRAAPFSLDRLETTGETFVLEAATMNQVFVAANGTFVYLGTNDVSASERLALAVLGRDGHTQRVLASELGMARHVRISPDGRRLAVTVGGLNFGAVWIHDLQGSAQPVKLTFRGGSSFPIWAPGGNAVFFQTFGPGPAGLLSVVADGSVAEPTRVLAEPDAIPEDWSKDGNTLLFQLSTAKTAADLMAFDRVSGQTRPWLQTEFNESEARFSPDGRTVAYVSDQTGRSEVWIRSFAPGGPTVRVSSDGGHEPRWSADGRELFFQNGARMMAAAIQNMPTLGATAPHALFEDGFVPYNITWRRTYDVTSDGRFVVVQRVQPLPRQPLVVVMHALDRGASR